MFSTGQFKLLNKEEFPALEANGKRSLLNANPLKSIYTAISWYEYLT